MKHSIQGAQTGAPTDSFGNLIDPVVGFARGSIIRSSTDEGRRLRQGQAVAAQRVETMGPASVGIFTGNQRDFLVRPEDLNTYCEEWVGPGLCAEALRRAAIEHLGGNDDDAVAVFNRTSAGIVSAIASLADNKAVVSIVPQGGRSHASVNRGAKLAGVTVTEVQGMSDWRAAIDAVEPRLVVVTTVTSSLERLDDNITLQVVEYSKKYKARVFLDEAYGARLRTVLHGGLKSLKLGADLTVTNCDKAGLPGPRAGVMVGRRDLVAAAAAKGSEYGMEARAPITAGVLRSLQSFQPEHLRDEARAGQALAAALRIQLGDCVKTSDLGPMVHEDDVMRIILNRAGVNPTQTNIVPCEATSALGMILLRDYGILTVNTHGQPGARISLRLKPSGDSVERIGGQAKVVQAVDEALSKVADLIVAPQQLAKLIFGEG